MSKQVQILNSIYNIPEVGEDQWGEETTALLEALADAIGSVVGPSDILVKEALLSNNQSVRTPINGFVFDSTTVQNIVANGVIIRKYPDILAKPAKKDTFIMNGASFDGSVSYNTTYIGDDAGVTLFCRDDGQIEYTSTNDSDTESIFIRFYGKAIVATEE